MVIFHNTIQDARGHNLPAMSSEESSSWGRAGLLLLLAFSGKALEGSFTRICYLLKRLGVGGNEYTLILKIKILGTLLNVY